ncbi:MAG: SH3 domain-containing protein [Spirochaetaceae bacterium]|nr:SH3 domain-containing protein [Spirochaetaceae bacterium]
MRFFSLKHIAIAALLLACLSSCTRKLGWGVLLWSDEERGIPSGTVLPVYIKSNIEKTWVVGVPKDYTKPGERSVKFGIPLAELDLVGGKSAAKNRAKEFGKYARTYAETLQDGLPIRESPDNSARRVYRLRQGEILKILNIAQGNPAISATGDPLPGDWFRVLTEDGTRGYCFSYRIRLFEHVPGTLVSAPAEDGDKRDVELEKVLTKTWVSEVYSNMVRDRKLDLDALTRKWGFSAGEDTGIAHVYAPAIAGENAGRLTTTATTERETDLTFPYTQIKSLGSRDWQLVDSNGNSLLLISLLSDARLSVQYHTAAGLPRTLYFTTLSVPLDDLIVQETVRRDDIWAALLAHGTTWRSAYYGRLYFEPNKNISWSGFDRLVPQYISNLALPSGRASLSLFLDPSLASIYDGALSIHLNNIGGGTSQAHFLYAIEDGNTAGQYGLRLEFVPQDNIEGVTVKRRTPSPTILYFYTE